MTKTKPYHYIIVIALAIGFLAMMRWRAVVRETPTQTPIEIPIQDQ